MAKNGNDLFEFKPVKHLIVGWNILTFDHTWFFYRVEWQVLCVVSDVLCAGFPGGLGAVHVSLGRVWIGDELFWKSHVLVHTHFQHLLCVHHSFTGCHFEITPVFKRLFLEGNLHLPVHIYLTVCTFLSFLVIFTVHNAVHIP